MEAFYNQDIEKIFKTLETSLEGLSQDEAKIRLQKFGPNEIILAEKPLIFKAAIFFLKALKNPIAYLLGVACLISIFVGKLADAFLIIVILAFNGLIETYYNIKGEKQMKALEKLNIVKSFVRRDNSTYEIDSREIVPGDIILIKEGDKITVDGRIIEANGLEVDESHLTGESMPVEKNSLVLKDKCEIHEIKNMVFAGSFVTRGYGQIVAINTGMNSYFGSIIKELQYIRREESDIEMIFYKLVHIISIFGLVVIFLIILFTYNKLDSVFNAFIFAIAVFVAMVPEGLPASVGLGLGLALNKLAKNSVITKNLSKIITLSAIDTICVDKTGTITENKMTVEKIFIGNDLITITNKTFFKNNELYNPLKDLNVRKFLEIAILNTGSIYHNQEGEFIVSGDPTENALVTLALQAQLDPNELSATFIKNEELPFNSLRRMRASLYTLQFESEIPKYKEIYATGAFENIWNSCSSFIYNDNFSKNPRYRNKIYHKIKKLEPYYRIIALAYKKVPLNKVHLEENDLNDLTFLGAALLNDPPRKNIKETIQNLKDSGVEIKIISGDALSTTENIAYNIGLIPTINDGHYSITGSDFLKLNTEKALKLLTKIKIFARSLPDLKLRIIKLLKKMDKKVLMTGDGINDVPALKTADVSFAMGESGTELAREASDFILTNDDFVNIQSAINESRLLHQNIRKVTLFLLMTNLSEILAIFYFVLSKDVLPLTPIQILWINLISDGLPIYALLNETIESSIKKKKPRFFRQNLLLLKDYLFLTAISLLFLLTVILLSQFYSQSSLKYLSTLIFESFVIVQVFNMVNVKKLEENLTFSDFLKNKFFLPILLISLLFSLILPFTRFGDKYLLLTAISFKDLVLLMAIGVSFAIIGQTIIKKQLNKFFKE